MRCRVTAKPLLNTLVTSDDRHLSVIFGLSLTIVGSQSTTIRILRLFISTGWLLLSGSCSEKQSAPQRRVSDRRDCPARFVEQVIPCGLSQLSMSLHLGSHRRKISLYHWSRSPVNWKAHRALLLFLKKIDISRRRSSGMSRHRSVFECLSTWIPLRLTTGFRHVKRSISFYPTQLSFRTFCSSNTLTIARMNLATVSEVYDSSNVTNVSAYLPHANPVLWNGTGAYHFTGPLFGTQIRDITAKRITLRSYQQRRFASDTMTRVPRARHADQIRPSQSCTPTGFTAHSSDFANARVQMIG